MDTKEGGRDFLETENPARQHEEQERVLRQAGWEPIDKPMTDTNFFQFTAKEPEGTLAVLLRTPIHRDTTKGIRGSEFWYKVGGVGVKPDLPAGFDASYQWVYVVDEKGRWQNAAVPPEQRTEKRGPWQDK